MTRPYVSACDVPGLRVILQREALSKVRIFEAWCEKGDRLVQVLRVDGRPLALALGKRRVGIMQEGVPQEEAPPSFNRHRDSPFGMWLDVRDEAWLDARLVAQCQHQAVRIWATWLAVQVDNGVRKRVMDAATLLEDGVQAYRR